MKKIIAEFIPILLIVLLALYTRQMVHYSHTILGRFIAILIIVFYCSIDLLLGSFACAVFIIFYQKIFAFNQYTEGMDTYCEKKPKTERPDKIIMQESGWKYAVDSIDSMNIGNPAYEERCLIEGMTNINTPKVITPVTPDKNTFVSENCEKGVLKNKHMKVNIEMAEHVFPELKFTGNKCNPCDKNCDYIVESKLNIEKAIITPKNSNDSLSESWANLMKPFFGEPQKAIGVVSEQFSFLK
jgi:hypothetical protein